MSITDLSAARIAAAGAKCAAAVSILSALPAVALAAGHGAQAHGPAPTIGSLIWPAVNFAIYLIVMVYLYRRLVRPALKVRAVDFEQRLRKAAQSFQEADREHSLLDERLREIEIEKQEIKDRLTKEGTQMAAQVLVAAEQSGAHMMQDVGRRIERELQKARAEVRQEVINRATAAARKQLEAVSAADDLRLRQEAIRGVEA